MEQSEIVPWLKAFVFGSVFASGESFALHFPCLFFRIHRFGIETFASIYPNLLAAFPLKTHERKKGIHL